MSTHAIQLHLQDVIELAPQPPFLFDATFHKLGDTRVTDYRWTSGVRWQTLRWQGHQLGLKFEDESRFNRPRIRVSVYAVEPLSVATIDALEAELTYRFGLDLDLSEFYMRFAGHRSLGPVLDRWRGMRPMQPRSLYEYLATRSSLKKGAGHCCASPLDGLLRNFGSAVQFDGRVLHCFWEPATLAAAPHGALHGMKLSRHAQGLLHVTDLFASGTIDERALRAQPGTELRRILHDLCGVEWAAVRTVMADVFHRYDEVSSFSPLARRRYSAIIFGTPPERPKSTAELRSYFEVNFAAYSTLAMYYFDEDMLWHSRNSRVFAPDVFV